MHSLQDFSLINTHVQKYMNDFNLGTPSSAFSYFALNLILGLQDDEIEDAITDNYLLKKTGKPGGHYRGIDALYIDYEDVDGKPKINFFNFKYTDKFTKTKNNFPSAEADSSKLEYIELLCRIYETKNSDLSTSIAEYTNSQNPVKKIFSDEITADKVLLPFRLFERIELEKAKIKRSLSDVQPDSFILYSSYYML